MLLPQTISKWSSGNSSRSAFITSKVNRPFPLSQEQKRALSKLEPMLRSCVASADLDKAIEITGQIQELLRPTGHEIRILQAKNWLYETALKAGNLSYAKSGFEETIQKSSPKTRLHLEAVSLLAICYLRERNINKVKELVNDIANKIYSIKSIWRRMQFLQRLMTRLEEESILAGLVDVEKPKLIVDEVEAETEKLVESKSQDQILLEIGKAVPIQRMDFISAIRNAYQDDLEEASSLRKPRRYRRFLPPPPLTEANEQESVKRVSSALKRVAWKAICSRDSEIYQAWNQGLASVYDMRTIAAAIVAAFNSWSIGIPVLAAGVAALAIKFGVDVFCEAFAPDSIMIDRRDSRL